MSILVERGAINDGDERLLYFTEDSGRRWELHTVGASHYWACELDRQRPRWENHVPRERVPDELLLLAALELAS